MGSRDVAVAPCVSSRGLGFRGAGRDLNAYHVFRSHGACCSNVVVQGGEIRDGSGHQMPFNPFMTNGAMVSCALLGRGHAKKVRGGVVSLWVGRSSCV